MTIQTRDFGAVDIDNQDIITFEQPIFGFEDYRRFVTLYDQNNSHIVWLQSLDEASLCFILVRSDVVGQRYTPESLPVETRAALGEGDWMFWLVTVVAPNFAESTVNLKSPIVLNPQRGCAAQVILEEDLPIRRPLLSVGGGRG